MKTLFSINKSYNLTCQKIDKQLILHEHHHERYSQHGESGIILKFLANNQEGGIASIQFFGT